MDQIDDPITPETGNLNGSAAVGTTGTTAGPEAAPAAMDPVGLRPGFLSELAVAMRATAERERENIGSRVAEDAAGHVEKVRARAAIETEELRRLAEEDVQHIEEWSASEMERIRAEADQKIGDRRASLDEYLKQHDAIIDTEIEGVDAAVRDYNTTLDQFFAELSESEDPATIVARAETLPPPPDLDQVRAQARASAVAMFAQPEADAPTAEGAATTEAVADNATDTRTDGGGDTAAGTPEAVDAEAVAAEAVAGGEAVAPEAVAGGEAIAPEAVASQPEGGATEAVATGTDVESEVEAARTAAPVPVMDPSATAEASWPDKEPEPAGIAPSQDNTSAAVRLLRSVAPWTAPTHSGSERGSDSD
jgi:hypothetical protein